MPWLKLKLEADKDRVEHVAHALEDCGALAVTVEDGGTEARFYVDPNAGPAWTHNRVTGLFPANTDIAATVLLVEVACRRYRTRQHPGRTPDRVSASVAPFATARGKLVLSGLLEGQMGAVCSHYAHRLTFERYLRDDEIHGHRWAMLVGSERHPRDQ